MSSMYEIEAEIQALVDTGDIVPEDQREEYERALIVARMMATNKRDRVAHFIAECEAREAGIDVEIKRLANLRQSYTAARQRVEALVVGIITSLGADENGRYPVLNGACCRFSVARNPRAVLITDEAAVPARFQVTVPETTRPCKASIKKALDAGDEVPGATWAPEKFSLRRR